MIRGVIFDLGGVLEVTPRTGWQRRWSERAGLTEAEFAATLAPIWRRGSVGELSLDAVERRTSESLGLTEAQLADLMEDLWTEYVGSLNHRLTAYFASLRPRYRTGILSNSFVGAREREQAAYGFEQLCDAIVYSHEEGIMKPDPRIYRIACDRLGIAPTEAVFLDDVADNVAAALELGMKAVRFLDTGQSIADVEQLLSG